MKPQLYQIKSYIQMELYMFVIAKNKSYDPR